MDTDSGPFGTVERCFGVGRLGQKRADNLQVVVENISVFTFVTTREPMMRRAHVDDEPDFDQINVHARSVDEGECVA